MGLIHLDAGAVIALLDGTDFHHVAATKSFSRAVDNGDRFAMSSCAFAECLVGPSRRGEASVQIVLDLFDRMPIAVVDLGEDIAILAAGLRAHHKKLRLPDAMVIATAIHEEADELVTTDRDWPTARAMKFGAKITNL